MEKLLLSYRIEGRWYSLVYKSFLDIPHKIYVSLVNTTTIQLDQHIAGL